jgi:hypothetical protein
MPGPDGNPEIKAIELGYVEHVKALFIALTTKLINAPVTHATDRQSANEFALAVGIAKRARRMALDAVGTTEAIASGEAITFVQAMAAAAIPQKPKPARSRKRK